MSNVPVFDVILTSSKVEADIDPIDLSAVDKEVTVVRVRGKLTLTYSQNETELGNVFKYLLEKVIGWPF